MSVNVIPSSVSCTPLMSSLLTTFHDRYGRPATGIVSAPGRVNVIGEHIDYAGYAVLPMAISKTVHIAFCCTEEEDGIDIQHIDALSFPSGTFLSDPHIPIPTESHAWYHYVQCGYKGAWLLYTHPSTHTPKGDKKIGCGMKMLVGGTIPLAAGLSSSSALVVASTVAALHARNFQGTLEELAELARSAEGYIGTMGGGMDQAISVLGESRLVHFNPVRTERVLLPIEAVFVIAHSLTSAEKAVTASLCYNKRVVEMMLAAKVLGTLLHLSDDILSLKTFQDVQKAYALHLNRNVSLEEMAECAREHLKAGGYSEVELADILPSDSWKTWFPHASVQEHEWIENVRTNAKSYALQERACHIYQEAARVHVFATACNNSASLETLGALMNESHTSCKDLYECSSPELDLLTTACRHLGAFGSRLTGAGWGGSTVSLVAADRVKEFMVRLKEKYYAKYSSEKFDEICFAAVSSPGVSVFTPTSFRTLT